MSEVKRYKQIVGGLQESADGDYVDYSDYQKLVAENAALKNRTVKVPAKVYVKDMKSNVVRWAQVIDALSDAGVAFVRDDGELIAGTREMPATDAAIAEIKLPLAAEVDACRQFIKDLGIACSMTAPETDHLLNHYKAQGADTVADYHKVRMDALIDVDRKGANEHKVAYMAARDVAANLRAGRKG